MADSRASPLPRASAINHGIEVKASFQNSKVAFLASDQVAADNLKPVPHVVDDPTSLPTFLVPARGSSSRRS